MKVHKDGKGQNYIKIPLPKRITDNDVNKWCDKDWLIYFSIGMLLEKFVDDEHNGYDALRNWTDELIEDSNNSSRHEMERELIANQAAIQDEILKLYKFWKALPKAEKRFCSGGYDTRPELLYSCYQEDLFHQLRYQFMHRVIEISGSLWT